MKKISILLIFLMMVGFQYAQTTITVNTDITSNTTWTNNNIYLLTGGFIYVKNNATLTIEPGTIIKGDAASLVITRGSKIYANGTPTQPIVMTSFQTPGNRSAGDWGGLLVLGNATINDPAGQRIAEGGIDATLGLYGGTDDQDSSGVIRYVRIEYAGIAYIANSETNGLTMGAVGSRTVIDHVQVSNGGDDAFEWFGGTVNTKYLVAKATLDDDFDTDYGFRGKNQFLVSLRDSALADVSKSNGFESDNDGSGSTNIPTTNPTFSNVTSVGPKATLTTTVNTNYGRALHLRRGTAIDIHNSVFLGWPVGLKIENPATYDNVTANALTYQNNVLAGISGALLDSSGASFNMLNWYNSNGNTQLTNAADAGLTDAFNYNNPNFLLLGTSPLASGADFSSANLQNAHFEQVAFKGAFDNKNDWTDCWTEWDSDNADYSTAPINYFGGAASVSVTGNTTFCQGGNVTLEAPAGYSYQWSNGETTPSIVVDAAGTYTVTLTNARGCTKTSDPVNVVVNSLPAASYTFSSAGSVVTFTNTSGVTGATYSWVFGDGSTATTENPVHTYAAIGTYQACLTVTDANGCSAQTCQTVEATVSIDDNTEIRALTVYPNPNDGAFTLTLDLIADEQVSIEVLDVTGKVITTQSQKMLAGNNTVAMQTTDLSEGVYFVQVKTPKSTQTVRVFVHK